jgi:hypothetical protein
MKPPKTDKYKNATKANGVVMSEKLFLYLFRLNNKSPIHLQAYCADVDPYVRDPDTILDPTTIKDHKFEYD